MKKAFTLLEVVVSLTIFMILILFLYKTLDQTKLSNKQFSNTLEKMTSLNSLNKIFLEDLLESKEFSIHEDKRKNSIVKIQTTNLYHNPYFSNVTYFVSKDKNLLRVESKEAFSIDKRNSQSFYNDSYIDKLFDDIEYFEAKESQDKTKILYVVKQNDKKEKIFFTAHKLYTYKTNNTNSNSKGEK